MTTTRAIVYCRISRDRTGEEAGVNRQEADCRSHVTANGWQLGAVLTDNDVSAYSGKQRPAYGRLMDAVKAGAVDVVVAWHPDRLTRSPRELEDLIDALEAGDVEVSTVRAGRWDLSTRSGRTQARLVGVVARDESEAKSERLRRTHEEKAAAGEYHGGRRHYGYTPNDTGGYDIVPAEAGVICEAAKRILAGEGVHGVVVSLNERGIPTAEGRAWRTRTLKRTLTSWTVCGRRAHHGEDGGPAKWPGILSRGERDRLARMFSDRRRQSPPRVALMVGLAYCGKCGAKLITGSGRTGRRVYICPPKTSGQGCGGIQVSGDGTDAFVAAAVAEFVDTKHLAAASDADAEGTDDATAELERIEAELDDLAADVSLSHRELLTRRAALADERDRLRATLANGARGSAIAPYVGGGLRQAWPTLTLAQRRAIVAAVVSRVEVSPATRKGPFFDDGRVAIEWRG